MVTLTDTMCSLLALTTLLEQVPQLVRPFHPQLTRTFVKSTSDPSYSVRTRAAVGLGELMKHQTRVDPLITELIGSIRSSEKDVAASMAQALAAVCASAGKNIGDAARASIVDLVEDAFLESPGGESVDNPSLASLTALFTVSPETYNVAMGKVASGLAKTNPEHMRSITE